MCFILPFILLIPQELNDSFSSLSLYLYLKFIDYILVIGERDKFNVL